MRVVTWNLGWRFGEWEPRQPAIDATLAATDADVIAVQETWPEQLARLADRLELHWAFSGRQPSETVEHGFGNGILSRQPIAHQAEIMLPALEGPAYRSALLVRTAPDGDEPSFTAVTTHLTHRRHETPTRLVQLDALRAFIDDNGAETGALVLLGDLNATPDSEEIRGLRDGWTDCWAECGDGDGWTWASANPLAAHARWPNRRLDYVLMRSESTRQPITARLVGICPIGGSMPSDHYGVLVELTD